MKTLQQCALQTLQRHLSVYNVLEAYRLSVQVCVSRDRFLELLEHAACLAPCRAALAAAASLLHLLPCLHSALFHPQASQNPSCYYCLTFKPCGIPHFCCNTV
jgi:hypothetical protein